MLDEIMTSEEISLPEDQLIAEMPKALAFASHRSRVFGDRPHDEWAQLWDTVIVRNYNCDSIESPRIHIALTFEYGGLHEHLGGERSGKKLLDRDVLDTVIRPRAFGHSHSYRYLHGFLIPRELKDLQNEVDRSRRILELDDDWDGEGSIGYAETTWRRAIALLVRIANRHWEKEQESVPVPRISNGPEGSIDLHWQNVSLELLINVPANDQEPITFYGDNGAGQAAIEGTLLLTDTNRWVGVWLTE